MRGVPKLLHVCPWIKTTGGVETLLARHAHADARLGFDDWQLGLFDRTPPKPGERYSTHRFGWKNTPRGMRRAIARSFEARAGSIVAWHNAWGLPWFADLDRSARRIACLQDSVTHFGPLLPGVAQWADGITCLSRSAAADILERLPGWPSERLVVLPLPLAPRGNPNLDRRPGRPVVVGAAGRLVRPQKRWDRLVPFVEELRRLGVDYRIEVTSGGPAFALVEKAAGHRYKCGIHRLGGTGKLLAPVAVVGCRSVVHRPRRRADCVAGDDGRGRDPAVSQDRRQPR